MARRSGREAVQTEERRAHSRHEVSLIARVDVAGRDHPAVVTSIAAEGAFVQFEGFAPIGTAIRLDLGLGEEAGRLRVAGRVAHNDKRHGASVVRGVGMAFDAPPGDLAERLERVVREQPEPLRFDPLGSIVWPLLTPVSRVPGDGVLVASIARRWATTEVPAPDETGLSGDDAYAAALDWMVHEADAIANAPARFFYRGRPLAPQEGLTVADALRSPALEALVAQMAAVDALESCGWRLERTDDRTTGWKVARGWIRESRKLIKRSESPAPWLAETRRALRKVEATLTAVLWAIAANRAESAALEPAEETGQGAPGDPPAARPDPPGSGAPSARATLTNPTVRSPRALSTAPVGQESTNPWWALVVAALALLGMAATLGVTATRFGAAEVPRGLVTPGDLRPNLPARSVATEAGLMTVTVSERWRTRDAGQRRADLTRAIRLAADRGYDQLIARTPDGRTVALWHARSGVQAILEGL